MICQNNGVVVFLYKIPVNCNAILLAFPSVSILSQRAYGSFHFQPKVCLFIGFDTNCIYVMLVVS